MELSRALLLALVFALAPCDARSAAQRPPYPVALKLHAEEVNDGQTLTYHPVRVLEAAPDTFLVLEERPARLVRLVPGRPPLTLLHPGEGPEELPAPLYFASRVTLPGAPWRPGTLLLHSVHHRSTLVLRPGAPMQTIRHGKSITSAVVDAEGVLASLYTSADATSASRLGGTERIGWFSHGPIERDRGTWSVETLGDDFPFCGEPTLDLMRTMSTRLLVRDADTLYRVSLFGSPQVEILDRRGVVLRAFAVPRGIPAAGVAAQLTPIERALYLRDVDVDAAGRLHALRGIYFDDEGRRRQAREILVFDREGQVQERYELETPVRLFCLADDARSYVGLEAESMRLLRFGVPDRVAD